MNLRSMGSIGVTWAAVLLVGLVVAGCGSDEGGTGTAPDTQAPVITSGPTVSSLTETTARITWTTNEAATSAVDFGLSTAYGQSQAASELSTTHSVDVTELNPYTVYHCRVVSTDSEGNEVTSTDVSFTTDKDFALTMADGWTQLAAGDAGTATTSFTSAMDKNPTSAEPHLGLGWCDWLAGDVDGAYTEFYACEALSPGGLDALAARAVAGSYREEYSQSIDDALAVLDADPAYTFPYIEAFDYNDLRVTLAYCYYQQGDYAEAQEQVDAVNPQNVLDPEAASYTTSLRAAINSLHKEYVDFDASDGGKLPTSASEMSGL